MPKAQPLVWRRIPERYRLVGSKCATCKNEFFPQRKFCPTCRRKGKISPHNMPVSGNIFSFSEVSAAPEGFEHQAPYFMAIVQLDNGVKLMSQLVDSPAESVKIGAPVKLVFRRIAEDEEEGAIAYGYKFKVVG